MWETDLRRVLGIVVLVTGLVVLGTWAVLDREAALRQSVADDAEEIASASKHPLDVAFEGRDLTVSGRVDDASAQDTLLEAFRAIDGVGDVRNALEILDTASPYVTAAARDGEGARKLEGVVPTATARAALSSAVLGEPSPGGSDLSLAAGAPEGWADATRLAEKALSQLHSGSWRLEDTTLHLEGTARNSPAQEAALIALAALDGFEVTTEIDIVPLLSPFATTGRKLPDGTVDLGGFGPAPAERAALGDLDTGVLARADGAPGDWAALVSGALDAMDPLAEGEFAMSDRQIFVAGKARDRAARDAAALALDTLASAGADVMTDIEIVPLIEDYLTEASKSSGAAPRYSGYVPSDYARSLLGGASGALILADGAPAHWEASAGAGNDALGLLDSGSWLLDGDRLTVTGVARSEEIKTAALSAFEVLEDVAVSTDIKVIPLADPFTTSGIKWPDGRVELDGFAPRAEDGLIRADGAPAEWQALTDAAKAALAPLAEGSFALSDRTLMVTGKARDAAARDKALAALDRLDAADILHDISVIPLAAPFRTEGVKEDGGAIALSGFAPAEYGLDLFGAAGADLVLADGAPGNWEALSEGGQSALSPLHSGTWLVLDDALTVVGIARTQEALELALKALEDVPNVATDITVIPEISPYITRGQGGAGFDERLSGHAPGFVERKALGEAGAELTLAAGAPADWAAMVTAAREALGHLHRGTWSLSDTSLTLTGVARDPEAKSAALSVLDGLSEAGLVTVIEVIPEIDLFETGFEKTADGSTQYDGYVPAGYGLELLGAGADALIRADGAPGNWEALAEGASAAMSHLAYGAWSISGDTLSLSGTARDAAAAEAAQAALRDHEMLAGEQDHITVEIRVRALAAPFVTKGEKAEGAETVYSGLRPDPVPGAAAEANGAGLEIADGAPETWAALFAAADAALAHLMSGGFEIRDRDVTVTGMALDAPAREAALAALAGLADRADVTVTTDIILRDSTLPAEFEMTVAEDGRAVLGGRVPGGLELDALSAALGITLADDGLTMGRPDAADRVLALFDALAPFMTEGASLDLTWAENGVTLRGMLPAEADLQTLQMAVLAAVPEATLAVDQPAPEPEPDAAPDPEPAPEVDAAPAPAPAAQDTADVAEE